MVIYSFIFTFRLFSYKIQLFCMKQCHLLMVLFIIMQCNNRDNYFECFFDLCFLDLCFLDLCFFDLCFLDLPPMCVVSSNVLLIGI